MKAILCSQYCGPDDLVLADLPDPVAGPNEAVMGIEWGGLNLFDLLMIEGNYQIKPPFPFSPAAEVAGVIESVGSGVTGLKVGDRVVASSGHNGAREKIALPANSIVKIPDNLDFDRAAGIIIIYGTALHALENPASLKPGETLAVLGLAGGDIPKMPLNRGLLKGCDIRGVFWGAWARLNPEKNRANLEKLVKWTAEGKISSHVDRTFPLAQTADALKVLAGRKAMGKVILHP